MQNLSLSLFIVAFLGLFASPKSEAFGQQGEAFKDLPGPFSVAARGQTKFVIALSEKGTMEKTRTQPVGLDTKKGKTAIFMASPFYWDDELSTSADDPANVLFRALSELNGEQKVVLTQTDKLPLSQISEGTRNILSLAAKKTHLNEESRVQQFFNTVIDRISKAPNSFLSVDLSPEIYIFEDKNLKGRIYFSSKEGKLKFNKVKANRVEVLEETLMDGDFFSLNIPIERVKASLLGKRLTILKDTLSVKQLSDLVTLASGQTILPTKNVSSLKLAVSTGEWDSFDLLYATCIAHGIDVRVVGDKLALVESKSALYAFDIKSSDHTKQSMKQKQLDTLRSIIAPKQLASLAQPFKMERFTSAQHIKASALSDTEQEVIRQLTQGQIRNMDLFFSLSYEWKLCDPDWKRENLTLNFPEQQVAIVSLGCEGFASSIPMIIYRGITKVRSDELSKLGGSLFVVEQGVWSMEEGKVRIKR